MLYPYRGETRSHSDQALIRWIVQEDVDFFRSQSLGHQLRGLMDRLTYFCPWQGEQVLEDLR